MYQTDIIRVDLGGSNSYLIKGKEGCILVDTGLKGAASKLEMKLRELGMSPNDISLVILTHIHYDHSQGAEEIRKLTGAPLAIHQDEILYGGERPEINESSLIFRMIVSFFSKIMPSKEGNTLNPDIKIINNMDLGQYGVEATVVHTPGHSPGSVCIFTKDGQCLAGDTLFDIFPWTHYPIIVYDRKNLAKTYTGMDAINPDIYYPGHGKPITRQMFKKKIINKKRYFDNGGQ